MKSAFKKNANVDFAQLERELRAVTGLQAYRDIERESICEGVHAPVPAESYYAMCMDMKGLTAQLIHYFTVVYRGFEFRWAIQQGLH